FDRLRWQMPGIALALSAGVIAVSVHTEIPLRVLAVVVMLMAIGVSVCAYAMRRIRHRLEENRLALIAVALRIGDPWVAIPEPHSGTRVLETFLWLVVACAAGMAVLIALHVNGIEQIGGIELK
ncbi:MAG: hypothetical protein ACREMY_26660, partial [bacterium]